MVPVVACEKTGASPRHKAMHGFRELLKKRFGNTLQAWMQACGFGVGATEPARNRMAWINGITGRSLTTFGKAGSDPPRQDPENPILRLLLELR